MTLIQLQHFVALATHGSFNKAAPAVHLTQPALSRSIQALGTELAQPLFDRVRRRVELSLKPALKINARLGLVTLAKRTMPPTLPLLKTLVERLQ